MTKFFIPPFTMLMAWFLVLLSARAGHAALLAARLPLALTLLTSLVSCTYVVLRLRTRRAEPAARQPYLLNVIAVVAFFVLVPVCAARLLLT